MSEQLVNENGGGWDDARIERALFSSGQRISTLSEARRAEMLQALLAESARLSASAQAQQPPKRTLNDMLDLVLQVFSPRVVGAMAAVFVIVFAAVAYALFGGVRPSVVANAEGSFALAETRQGVLGLKWALPRSYATSTATVHAGDEVFATSPVTITFADGSQTVATAGSQLKLLPGQGLQLVKGEIVADTVASTDEFKVESHGATFVATDATFRVRVDETGTVSQFTDQGKVVAQTGNVPVEVLAGEQASVTKDGQTEKGLQPPVVAGEKTDEGALAFTARTATSATLVVLDSQTGAELARFNADENGVVSGQLVPPPGTTPASIEFRADGPDGRKSELAATVSDGKNIASASTDTTLPPSPVQTPTAYSVPMLTLPVLAPVQATSKSGATVGFSVAASDAQDGNLTAICDATSGATFPLGTTAVTCSATNSQGRTATGAFKVTVVDTTPPTLKLPDNQSVSAVGAGGAPVSFSVSASDAVDGTVTPSCTPRSGATFPLKTTIVECTATDSAGNAIQGKFEVAVLDKTAPAIQVPDSIFAPATSRAGAEVTFAASANDAVDGAITPVCTPRSGSSFGVGAHTVNCVATDRAGNTSSSSFAVSVRDSTAPTLDVPNSVFAQATSASGAVVTFPASGNDAVDGTLAATCTPRSGSPFPIGNTTVTCRTSDGQGNNAARSFVVTVGDTAAPKLELPDTVTAPAVGPNGASVTYSASANDAVDGAVTPVCTPRSGSTFVLGTTSVTCRASDSRGNQASNSFNVVVRDTAAPTINLPSNISTEATSASGAAVSFNASARDAVDGSLNVSCSPASGATFSLGKNTVKCTVADKTGNEASGSFEVTVVDTTPPSLKLPETFSTKATSKSGAIVSFDTSASDIVDGSVTPVCAPRSGSPFAFGETTVNCRAADNAGNSTSGNFKVTVLNTTAPVLSLPPSQTVEATSSAGATATFSISANDDVDGAITPTCDWRSGATFPLGVTTVTCRAVDEAGNTASGSFNVTVRDTTAPEIKSPANQTAEATGKSGAAVSFAVSATDKVDGKVDAVCTPRSGSVFGLGTSPVSCRVTDKAGNSAPTSFNVTVRDTTAPALNLPALASQEATSGAGAAVIFSVSATDVVDGAVTPSCTPRSGSTFGLGKNSVKCTAADAAGNSVTNSFEVSVVDTKAPALNLPSNITVPAAGPSGAAASFTASATDVVDGAVGVKCDPVSGSTFGVGTNTVRCTAQDKSGNAASGSFSVIVVDNVAPVIALPKDKSVLTNDPAGIAVTFDVSANDAIDGAVDVSCSNNSGSLFPVGTTTVSCSAKDKSGNGTSGTFNIVVTYVPPTPTPSPSPTPDPSPTPEPTPTSSPTPPPTSTPSPVPPTPTPTPEPPTPTPVPPTPTPVPPTATQVPTQAPTQAPTATVTSISASAATSTATSEADASPVVTQEPIPTATTTP